MSSSTSYPFYQDLKTALIALTTSAVNSRCHIQNTFAHLTPSPAIEHTGCWCSHPFYPYPHDYTSCPHTSGGPNSSVVANDAELRSCWHSRAERRTSACHKLFCFDPAVAAAGFMDWFMLPRPFLLGHMELRDEHQRDAILRSLQEYELRCPVDGPSGPNEEKFDVLCRLLVDMRRDGITYEARMASNSWDAERVLAVLKWKGKGFNECLSELVRAMRTAAETRVEREELQRAAARGRQRIRL
ncbi:hypothetical protein TARUN_2987 [Trichoderma arundinaceum]|uniref:Uncharacterized protein n=1 Tax=Trichoderma arundinaceum TaxID=490622 RepID=A0A395NTI1_TRIAR|nr:hypothetical protein TARUN_2987 [Trichoderma arundinaceum]